MNDIFRLRREYTQTVFDTVVSNVRQTLGDRFDEVIGRHTFVYATGSCGRGEMGPHSDLDVYVVRSGQETSGQSLVQQAIEAANIAAGLPALDGGGRHIETTEAHELIDRLGAPEDDTREEGAFTKRMLLLLESRVIAGQPSYEHVLEEVVDAYWQNADLHPRKYQPFVLVNDIVRWWRIVLLDHESRLRKRDEEFEGPNKTARLLAERRYRSHKMRLARCMTCFSALTYLLALAPTDASHVTKEQILDMVKLAPLDRIERLPELAKRALEPVPALLDTYASYLERAGMAKETVLQKLENDPTFAREISNEGGRFTELMFELVQDLGGGRRLHRHMLV